MSFKVAVSLFIFFNLGDLSIDVRWISRFPIIVLLSISLGLLLFAFIFRCSLEGLSWSGHSQGVQGGTFRTSGARGGTRRVY